MHWNHSEYVFTEIKIYIQIYDCIDVLWYTLFDYVDHNVKAPVEQVSPYSSLSKPQPCVSQQVYV